MRPLEALFVGALILSLGLRWARPRNRQVTSTLLAMIGIMAALHVFFDGMRWEMIPAYGMALAAAWIMARDLQRATGAKAGESSRWAAVPSAGQRAASGAALLVVAAAAAVIPAWLFPRVALTEPDGLYWVGRLDIAWTDSARQARPVPVSVWYPAEAPNGRPLRYHPEAGALAAGYARGTPLPGFAFRNLAAARTHSTGAPRFSIREGRSPVVVVSHPVGGTRTDGTALYEQLASHGYVVASIGHAGSAAEDQGAPADRATEIGHRTADLQFVLDRLLRLPLGGAIDTLATHVRADRVALMGRGEGAVAAAEVAAGDSRVTAVAAIVPDTFAAVAQRGVRRPFLVFTVGSATPALDDAMRYGGTEVHLEGATPRSLSDLALLGTPIVGLLGIESGDAAADIHAAVSALTLRFFDQYLKERRQETEVDLPSRVRLRVVPHAPRAN